MTVWRASASARAGAPLVVGHRGGRGEGWPQENTMAAFERARAEGAVAVETDVRLTADRVIVLCHDKAHHGALVAHTPRASLRDLTTLEELLAWARGTGVAVNEELKRDTPTRLRPARAVARAIARRRAGDVDVIFSSFDPALVGAMAALASRVPRAFLVHARHGRLTLPLARAAFPPLVHALHPERTQADPARFARAKARGLAIGVYTVNDPAEGRRLAAMGVDWIFTDAPGALLAALNRS